MLLSRIDYGNLDCFRDLIDDSTFKSLRGKSALMLGAVEDDTACGVCVALTGSESGKDGKTYGEIIYLYVAEPLRRKGIATELFDRMLEGLAELGVKQVLVRYGKDFPTEMVMDRMLLKKDTPIRTVCVENYRVELKDTAKSTTLSRMAPTPAQKAFYVPLGEVAGFRVIDFLAKAKGPDAAWYRSLQLEEYSPELSSVYLSKGQPAGICLVAVRDDYYEMELLYSRSSDVTVPGKLVYTSLAYMRSGKNVANTVRFTIPDIKLRRMAEKVLPEAEHESVFYHYGIIEL